jgi:hypothetical protein
MALDRAIRRGIVWSSLGRSEDRLCVGVLG